MDTGVPFAGDGASRQLRREAVLAAARKVFEMRGLDGASIRLIAKEAGCTTGSIYPYFKGKEEIYAEVLSLSLDDYKARLVADVDAAKTPEARFEAALWSHFRFYETRPSDMSLALYLFNGLKPQGLTRELDARLNEQLISILTIFKDCLRSMVNCSARDAEIEVGLHFSMLFGLLTLLHTKRTRVFKIDPRALLKLHIRRSVERLTAGS
ncbi:TetR family transcriptional regulator [Chelatococcus reniformis]|uniref:TetR family transcriptional regulator n=2 Tax=Chelatococcus reniformis TaxID=1494448 RepID=A0A916ULU1_9HYPH|nr:TetR family transcriptional regulator [Chelatococcus reniformis]